MFHQATQVSLVYSLIKFQGLSSLYLLVMNNSTVNRSLAAVIHSIVPYNMRNPQSVIAKHRSSSFGLCLPVHLNIAPLRYTLFIFPKRKREYFSGIGDTLKS